MKTQSAPGERSFLFRIPSSFVQNVKELVQLSSSTSGHTVRQPGLRFSILSWQYKLLTKFHLRQSRGTERITDHAVKKLRFAKPQQPRLPFFANTEDQGR